MRIKPKKSLGQNFLIDRNVLRKIISSLELKPTDTFLEIGAGRAEASLLIAPFIHRFYAVELDKRLIPILSERLKDYKNVSIINKDILKFNLKESLLHKQKIKVFGNIPYYISTPIIEYLIKNKAFIEEAFITVQKDFALRLVASPGSKEYGSLSIFLQYFALPKVVMHISRGSFYPVPKVDSTLLHLKFLERPKVKVKNQELFFRIVRSAFTQRRKRLRNSLKKVVEREKLEGFLLQRSKGINLRPEELPLEDFASLANSIS
ncbi:MAG: 16S rRNA (adenine(1518)-N(6)/adenine(1519)-N(6))-dimethyltransferase RsmA [Candidatus Omnitrophota bacterium]